MRMALFSLALVVMASMVIALFNRIVSMVVVMVMVMVMIVVVVVIMDWSRSSCGGDDGYTSGGCGGCGRRVVMVVVMIVFTRPLLQDIEVFSKGSVVQNSLDLDRALRSGEGRG